MRGLRTPPRLLLRSPLLTGKGLCSIYEDFPRKKNTYMNSCSRKMGVLLCQGYREDGVGRPCSLAGEDDISALTPPCVCGSYIGLCSLGLKRESRFPPPSRGCPTHPHFSAEGAAGNGFSRLCWWKFELFPSASSSSSLPPASPLFSVPLVGLWERSETRKGGRTPEPPGGGLGSRPT